MKSGIAILEDIGGEGLDWIGDLDITSERATGHGKKPNTNSRGRHKL